MLKKDFKLDFVFMLDLINFFVICLVPGCATLSKTSSSTFAPLICLELSFCCMEFSASSTSPPSSCNTLSLDLLLKSGGAFVAWYEWSCCIVLGRSIGGLSYLFSPLSSSHTPTFPSSPPLPGSFASKPSHLL